MSITLHPSSGLAGRKGVSAQLPVSASDQQRSITRANKVSKRQTDSSTHHLPRRRRRVVKTCTEASSLHPQRPALGVRRPSRPSLRHSPPSPPVLVRPRTSPASPRWSSLLLPLDLVRLRRPLLARLARLPVRPRRPASLVERAVAVAVGEVGVAPVALLNLELGGEGAGGEVGEDVVRLVDVARDSSGGGLGARRAAWEARTSRSATGHREAPSGRESDN